MDLNTVLAALTSLSAVSNEERLAAEYQLYAWSQEPGLCAALATIFASAEAPLAARQWAAVMLKDQIKENWCEEEEDDADGDAELGTTEVAYDDDGNAIRTTTLSANALANATLSDAHTSYLERFDAINPIPVPEADKDVVRAALPALLADSNHRIRVLAGNCIAAVAVYDFPDYWPAVLPGLIDMVSARASAASVQGALRCLSLITEDLGDERLLRLVPTLFPVLLAVVQPDAATGALMPPAIRAQALKLYSVCLTGFSYLEDAGLRAFQRSFTSYVTPTLHDFMSVVAATLTAPLPATPYADVFAPDSTTPLPVGSTDAGPDGGSLAAASPAETMFAVRAEAVRLTGLLVALFPALMKPAIADVAPVLFQAFCSAVPYYLEYVVFADTMSVPSDTADDTEPHYGVSSFVSACISFLSTLSEDSRSAGSKLLRAALPQLAPSLSALLMVTAADAETYAADASVYVEAEETAHASDERPEGYGDDDDDGGAAGGGSGGETAGGVAGVRDHALVLIGHMVDRWPVSAPAALASSAVRLLTLGDQLRDSVVAGSPGAADPAAQLRAWWRPREAGTLVLGQFLEVIHKQSVVTLESVLETFVLGSLNLTIDAAPAAAANAAVTASPETSGLFLRARVAWLAGPLATLLARGVVTAAEDAGSGSATAQQAATVAAGGHATLAQLCSLLAACLADGSAGPQLRLSAARSIRTCGVAVGDVDAALLKSGLYAQLPSLQAGALAAWLSPLCALASEALATGGASGSRAVHQCLAALAWACYAGSQWHATLLHFAAKKVGGAAGHLAGLSGVEGATLYALASDPAIAACVHTELPTGAVDAVRSSAEAVAATVLAAWQQCPLDHVVAEFVLDAVQALAKIPQAGTAIVASMVPSLVQVLATPGDTVPASVHMIALNLASILLRSAAPAPSQADVLNVAQNVPGAAAPTGEVSALRDTAAVAAAAARVPAFAPAAAALAAGTLYSPTTVLTQLLPAVVELGMDTDESHLVRGCVSLTSTILALYGPQMREILSTGACAAAPGVTADAVAGVISGGAAQLLQRMLVLSQDPAEVDLSEAAELNVGEDAQRVSELTLAPAGRLVVQLLTSFLDVLGDAQATAIFTTVVRKLLTAQLEALKIAFLLAFARVVAGNAVWAFTALQGMGTIEVSTTVSEPKKKGGVKGVKKGGKKGGKSGGGVKIVTKEVPALTALVSLWLKSSENLYSQYVCQVSLAAMSTLLQEPSFVAALAQMTVDGFPAPVAGAGASAGRQTRASARASGLTPTYTKVSALHKLVAVAAAMTDHVCRVQERALKRLRGEAVGEDDDEEDDLADMAFGAQSDDDGDGDGDDARDDDDAEEAEAGDAQARKAENRLKRQIERSLRGGGGGAGGDSVFTDAGDMDMARLAGLVSLEEQDPNEMMGTNGAAFDTSADEEDFPEYPYDILFHTDAASLGLSVAAAMDAALVQNAGNEMDEEHQQKFQAVLARCGRA